MYTVYYPELADLVREVRRSHDELLHGLWTPSRLEAHQAEQVSRTIEYVKQRSPFYHERFRHLDTAAVRGGWPASLADVPPTTKEDLRAAQFDLLSRPLARAWVFYETTGTTSAATPCPRDNLDSLHNNVALTAYYESVFQFLGDNQVIGISGPSELHATGDTFGDVCRNLGLTVAKLWPHSPMMGFTRALEVLRALPVTGLFCTPGMALTLAKQARAAGLDPELDFALEVLMLTGELASPSLLDNIGRLWGARALNCLYASQEVSVLAAVAGDGELYTVPIINYYEVVDPVTLESVPPGPGGAQEGELVVTNLYRGSKPLVRYRTGDLVRLLPPVVGGTVPAQRLFPLGRVRDRMELNGVVLSGYELEELVLGEVRGYLDYQIVVDEVARRDRVTLRLQGDLVSDGRGLDKTVERFRSELDTELNIAFQDLGAVTSTGAMVSWKAARVVDRRPRGRVGPETGAEKAAALALAARRAR